MVNHQEAAVQILPNISAEVLQIWHSLRPLTSNLNDAGIRYKWLVLSHLQVIHNGKALWASNMEEGQNILYALGFAQPPESSEMGQKKT